MSSKQTVRRPRDGCWLDDMVADGEEISCPLYICDGFRADLVRSFGPAALADAEALHRPGHRLADAAARDRVRRAREAMIDAARAAWKMDRRRKPPDDDDDDEDDEDDE